MDESEFRAFLKRGGRSPGMVQRVMRLVQQFSTYLQDHRGGKGLDEAAPEDVESYVSWIEETPGTSAKTPLHAIAYYYEYTANEEVRRAARQLRRSRIKRAPFPLKSFRGVDPEHLETVLELVKLSDLARIPGVKGIRARLYVDAGLDTLEKIASYEAEEFRALVVAFVERTGFAGVATLPAEARFTIEQARTLPKLVAYE